MATRGWIGYDWFKLVVAVILAASVYLMIPNQVDEALGRIDKERYGVCIVCSNAVEKKRLDALPWARHCLSCQELQEQGLL